MKRGKFVAICGPDCSGKSTYLAQLIAALSPAHAILSTREPTASLPSQAAHADWRIASAAYALDRAEHSRNVIVPALERGEHVLCDRYLLSNVANTVARVLHTGDGFTAIDVLRHLARAENLAAIPDAVIVLDAPGAVLDARIAARGSQASAADVAPWRHEMRAVYRAAEMQWSHFAAMYTQLRAHSAGSADGQRHREELIALRTPWMRTRFYTVDTSGTAAETHERLMRIVGEVLDG